MSSQRLMADLKELLENPLHGVSASPVEDNLYVWHVNLVGMENSAFDGALFHLELSFPPCYPSEPPSVRVLTPIPHPHVHGDKVCLDLLSDYSGYFQRSGISKNLYGGWSNAYSVLSILVQLQAVLLNFELDEIDHAPQDGERVSLEKFLVCIPDAILESRAFRCPKCPHVAPAHLWPPIIGAAEAMELERQALMSSIEENLEKELVCFHSRKTWHDDVLGFGLNLDRKGNSIRDVSALLDFVGWTAYREERVRSGQLPGSTFTHWIPLFINEEHAKRAWPLLEYVIADMHFGATSFHPEMGLQLMCKMMNFFIVSIFKKDVHISEHALEGYCYFHRWLLALVEKYPSLLEDKSALVGKFISNPRLRDKKNVPALGEFFPLIALPIRYGWQELKDAYLSECYDRNAKWIINRFPHLDKTVPDTRIDARRPEESFESCAVSLKLNLFHIYFLENIARPRGVSTEQVKALYDRNYGKPSKDLRDQWRDALLAISNISSWEEYFHALGDKCPTREALNAMLRKSVDNSYKKAYHSRKGSKPRSRNGGGR